MASDLNRVLLVGRLTRNPELKSTNSGAYFCRFTLASNRVIWKKDAPSIDEVGFYDCILWGKGAGVVAEHVKKGQRLGVDGQLRWSSWENSEGKKQSKVEINVENFQFLDSKQTTIESPENKTEHLPTGTMNDDDISF